MFYVYELIDPRSGLPFYVGKGSGDRCYHHLRETSENTCNPRKQRTIANIHRDGLQVEIKKLATDMTEEAAFALEEQTIARYGRKNVDPEGILTNLCSGGEGRSGAKHSLETRQLLSEINSGEHHFRFGKPLPLDVAKKIGDAQRGKPRKKHDEATKAKIGQASKNMWAAMSDEDRKKFCAKLVHKKSDEEIEKIRSKLIGRIVPVEERVKMSAAKKGKPWTEARRNAQRKKP